MVYTVWKGAMSVETTDPDPWIAKGWKLPVGQKKEPVRPDTVEVVEPKKVKRRGRPARN